jgi:hypothetical protein
MNAIMVLSNFLVLGTSIMVVANPTHSGCYDLTKIVQYMRSLIRRVAR